MKNFHFVALFLIFSCIVITTLVASQQKTEQRASAQNVVTPTLYCLGADCPGTTASTSPIPSLAGTGAGAPQPKIGTPCANTTVTQSDVHPDQKKGRHRGEGGFLKDIFKFFLLLIELVLKLGGGSGLPCSPSTTPSVTVAPTSGVSPAVSTVPAVSTAPAVSNTPPVNGSQTPNQILDLKSWKLTLPIGAPTEISASQLTGGYQDQYFHTNNENGVVFNAPVQGDTTANSTHTRSELRELSPEGKTPWGWSVGSGSHVMKASEAITHLPGGPGKSGRVGFAQIHGPGSTWYLILEAADNNDGTITLKVHDQTKQVDGTVIDPKYVLGTKFDLVFSAVNGTVTVTYNGEQKVSTTSNLQDAYFKIGAYNQSEGDYGETVVYSLSVQHN